MTFNIRLALLGSAILLVLPVSYAKAVESGFYLGGSVGGDVGVAVTRERRRGIRPVPPERGSRRWLTRRR